MTDSPKKQDASKTSVFAALDSAKFSLFHIKTIVVAGSGFMCDAYDLFCIGMLTKLLGRVYYTSPTCKEFSDGVWSCSISAPGALPINQNVAVSAVALVGTLCGQLVWGRLGDMLGRKMVYGLTLITMFVAAICSAMSFGTDANGVIGTLCTWRFFLGFGIGGDYPLSAVIMSEYSSTFSRGAYVTAVFAMQGTGYIIACTLVIIITAIAMAANPSTLCNGTVHCYPVSSNGTTHIDAIGNVWNLNAKYIQPSDDYVWRVVLAFGALPALFTLYYRLTMPETARYTALVQQKADQATADMQKVLNRSDLEANPTGKTEGPSVAPLMTFTEFWNHKSPNFFWQCFGTASTWCLLDIAFYSQSLFQKDVFTTVGWLPSAKYMNALEETMAVARAQAIVTLSSTIPGYWATVFTVDILGRRNIQIMGFVMMTLLMALLSGLYTQLNTSANVGAFVALYCLTFFFANWGPNSTTYVIPSELFPAHFRATCHGISAACGKLGAIIGATGFLYASQPATNNTNGYPNGIGLQQSLGLLAAVNFIGLVISIFLTPETSGKSLEELNGSEVAMKPTPGTVSGATVVPVGDNGLAMVADGSSSPVRAMSNSN